MADTFNRLQTALADRYGIERELGRGGMATVYLAQDRKHNRPVALKVLSPDLAAALAPERFLREIRLAASLQHPHILPVFDSGDASGQLWYVMPYVEGESLRERLKHEKQLPLNDVLKIGREVASALACAHSHGILHRDIKPENILFSGGEAVVADFGVARALNETGGDQLTQTGIAVGTPAYMSPEQAVGDSSVDERSDVYSLGCVLYEMLAGEPPFTGPTPQVVIAKRLSQPAPPLRIVRDVPPALEQVVLRTLAKAPIDRFPTAAQLGQALAALSGAGTVAAPTHLRERRLTRAQLLPLVLAAAALVAVGGGLRVFRSGRETPARGGPAYERTFIAVLPFQNLSSERSHAYFARGLHDELLTQLSKVSSLRVISRTSVMGYQGSRTPLRQIASELRVGSVVEGSVQVLGGRLRVNVQLIDAITDAHLWAERYDRTLDDAFAIQSDIAQHIVAAVGTALSDPERQGLAQAPTSNPETYRLYLQGREYQTRPGYHRQNLEIAQRFYEHALATDPDFALARAQLSRVHGLMYWFRYDPSPERMARQLNEAETALRLGTGLPEAHVAMGLAHYWGRGDYRAALEEFMIALEALPNEAQLWALIGAVHRRLGNWNDALAAFQKATQLNPRDADVFLDLGGDTYRVMHRYAEAVRAFDRAYSLAPDLHVAAVFKGRTYVLWHGQLDTLRAVLNRLPMDAELGELGTSAAQHAQLLLWERNPDSLLQVLTRAGTRVFEGQLFFLPSSLYAAWAHQLRGNRTAARAAFESARVLVDSVLRLRPDDWRLHVARGLALAGLAYRDEAVREAHWLQQSTIYRNDAFAGPELAEDRARILAQARYAERALDEIERLLSRPSSISSYTLQLDPRWDPIRGHPRFKRLLLGK